MLEERMSSAVNQAASGKLKNIGSIIKPVISMRCMIKYHIIVGKPGVIRSHSRITNVLDVIPLDVVVESVVSA